MPPLVRSLLCLLLAVLVSACTSPKAAELIDARSSTALNDQAVIRGLQRYLAVANGALRNGNVDRLQELTGQNCPCGQLVRFIRDSYADGGRLNGAKITANKVRVLEARGDEADVRAEIKTSQYDVHSVDGFVSTEPAVRYIATYTLRKVGQRWIAIDVKQNRR